MLEKILVDLVEQIIKLHRDKPVVVLGRDAWPIIPLLRESGRPCIYQMLSRISAREETVMNNYLHEAEPNSLVIDTGYAGSIINAIRQWDPTVEGLLMYSHGIYPQMIIKYRFPHGKLIEDLEHMPKLVGRAFNINLNSYEMMCKVSGDCDNDRIDHPLNIQEQNIQLLERCGLSHQAATKYSLFTGVTREERIGLSGDSLVRYLRKIKKLRKENKLLYDIREINIAIQAAFRNGELDHAIHLKRTIPALFQTILRNQKILEKLEAKIHQAEIYLDASFHDPDDQRYWENQLHKYQRRYARYYRTYRELEKVR